MDVSPHNPSGPVSTAASTALCATLPNFDILEYQWGEQDWRSELVQPAEIFSDGIGRYRFTGGVVRVDYLSGTNATDQNNPEAVDIVCRMIMMPDTFVKSVAALNELARKIIDAGYAQNPQVANGDDQSALPGDDGQFGSIFSDSDK